MYDRAAVLPPKFDLREVYTGPKTALEWNISDGQSTSGQPFDVARFASRQVAETHLAHFQKEHVHGRVAQARCEHGPCDFLCDAHAHVINALQRSKAVP